MFGISYETWKSVCEMYFTLRKETMRHCLQWFPFTRLTYSDEELLVSKSFFDEFIKTGTFLLYSDAVHQSDNFMQKSDGSFRNATLIAPILYLVLQSVGKTIHEHYNSIRPRPIAVYYAGNFTHERPHYKQDYDDFFKELNASVDEYQYYIKTDITNFFSNINLDKLLAQIDRICNAAYTIFPQTQLHLFKELLAFCGNGHFPLVENSIASSYLATVVYLDEVDTKLYNFISDKVSVFSSFRFVRYVDDLYILISSNKPTGYLNDAYNEIRNEYSSLLKEVGLAINTSKCRFAEIHSLNDDLKKSLYDEFFNDQKHNIEELFHGALYRFLCDLSTELILDSVDIEKYNKLIEKHFSSDDIEFTSTEVFNYFVYEDEMELLSAPVIKEISDLVKYSISFIALDPRRLTIMIMKTKDEGAIKGLLNQLFERDRKNNWNLYDTSIAISYLIQRNFRHPDLLAILLKRHAKLHEYYTVNCKNKFVNCLSDNHTNALGQILMTDSKAMYLYFMYLCEMKRENYMVAFAYHKSFFDRVTADLEFKFNRQPREKHPNYKGFYRDESLIKIYKKFENGEKTIKKAQTMRHSNPLCHSSSELLDCNDTSKELIDIMNALMKLLNEYAVSCTQCPSLS